MTTTPVTHFSAFTLLLLFVAMILVVGLAIALRGRGRALVVGILLTVAIGVVLFVGMFFGHQKTASFVSNRGYSVGASPVVLASSAPVSPEATAWSVEADPQFLADVYPSVAAAAEALVGKLALDANAAGRHCDVIYVSGSASDDVLERAREALQRAGVAQAVEIAAGSTRPAQVEGQRITGAVRVEEIVQGQRTDSLEGRQRQGRVVLSYEDHGRINTNVSGSWSTSDGQSGSADANGMSSTRSVGFVEKRWLSDQNALATADPQRRWIVAGSDRPCSDSHMADDLALRLAAARLSADIRAALARTPAGERPLAQMTAEDLQAQIAAELQRQGLVADRFMQLFHRPYGNVYQGWVLVGATPAQLDGLAQNLLAPARQARQTLLARLLSVAGILAVMGLVYVFLNAATRGYYVWSLRIAAIILAAAGVGLVVYIL